MEPARSRRDSLRRTLHAALSLTAAAWACAPAAAPAAPGLDRASGYVALMSNYVGRGLSQSVGRPSLQLEVNYYASSGWYAGLDVTTIEWVDKVYPGSSVPLELDAYAGYRWIREDWTARVYAMRLAFPGRYAPQQPPAARPDTTELVAAVAWRGLGAKLNYAASDSFGTPDSRGSWYLDLAAERAFGERWRLGAHVARKQPRGRDPRTGARNARTAYTAYKLAATRALGRGFSLGFEQTWTTADPAFYTVDGYNVAGSHFAVVVLKSF